MLALWLPFQAAAADAPDLKKAGTLLRDNRAAEAYELLRPFEADFAGEPEFDYLFGVAALETGRPAQASIALERALIVNPDFVGARLDLARAYFELKDFDRAKLEMNTVLAQDPPPAARETIDRYLAEIDSRIRTRQRRLTAYLEGTLGYDTNVNNSTSTSTVFVPLFGLNLALAPTSVKSSDAYFMLGGGAELAIPLSEQSAVFAGIDARHRVNFKEDLFDYNRFDGRIGFQHAVGRNLFRATYSRGRFYLDNHYNYENNAYTLEWRHALDARNVVTLLGQHSRLRFPDPALVGNSVNQTIGGIGWGHAFNPQGTTFVFSSIHFGREWDTDERIDGERGIIGARLVGQYGFDANLDLYATLGVQDSDYDTENFVFQATRHDKLYEAALGLVWRLQRDWSLRPQITYTRNSSTIAIYHYDRWDLSVTVRRDFR
jgi:hypothetical protein